MYQLKTGKQLKTLPKIGFNLETLEYKGLNLTIWDVNTIRVFWKHYYQNTSGLIFVVDSNDRERIEDAAEEMKIILEEDELKNIVVLVMANKQDLSGALSPTEVSEKFGMSEIKERQWFVQGTSATTGQGLKEGLDWMAEVLLNKK